MLELLNKSNSLITHPSSLHNAFITHNYQKKWKGQPWEALMKPERSITSKNHKQIINFMINKQRRPTMNQYALPCMHQQIVRPVLSKKL